MIIIIIMIIKIIMIKIMIKNNHNSKYNDNNNNNNNNGKINKNRTFIDDLVSMIHIIIKKIITIIIFWSFCFYLNNNRKSIKSVREHSSQLWRWNIVWTNRYNNMAYNQINANRKCERIYKIKKKNPTNKKNLPWCR